MFSSECLVNNLLAYAANPSVQSMNQILTWENVTMAISVKDKLINILHLLFDLSFDMVEIIGKRNNKVPVLLTPDVKSAIDVLISTREDGNVSSNNEYVFAINNGKSTKSLRGETM